MHMTSIYAIALGLLCGGVVNFLSYKVPLSLERRILLDSAGCLLGSGRNKESSSIDSVIGEMPVIKWRMLSSFYYNLAMTVRSLIIAVFCVAVTFTCFSLWSETLALSHSVFFITLVLLSVIDWEHHTLPDELTQPLLWLGITLSLIGMSDLSVSESITGALVGYLIFDIMAKGYWLIRREIGLGRGDVKLMASVGAWLGHRAVIDMLPYVFTTALLFYVVFHWGVNRKVEIPFGPSIAIGAIIVVLIDSDVLRFSSVINL